MKATIQASELKRLIDATKEFISQFDNRPTYRFIRLEFSADLKVFAVAVDGYRMSVESASYMTLEEPIEFVAYIKPTMPKFKKGSYAEVEVNGEYAYINIDGNVVGYRQPNGEFIDWRKVIPETEPIYRIGFNGSFMLSALRAAKYSIGGIFKKPVVLEFRDPKSPIVLRTGENNIKIVLPIRI